MGIGRVSWTCRGNTARKCPQKGSTCHSGLGGLSERGFGEAGNGSPKRKGEKGETPFCDLPTICL